MVFLLNFLLYYICEIEEKGCYFDCISGFKVIDVFNKGYMEEDFLFDESEEFW